MMLRCCQLTFSLFRFTLKVDSTRNLLRCYFTPLLCFVKFPLTFSRGGNTDRSRRLQGRANHTHCSPHSRIMHDCILKAYVETPFCIFMTGSLHRVPLIDFSIQLFRRIHVFSIKVFWFFPSHGMQCTNLPNSTVLKVSPCSI